MEAGKHPVLAHESRAEKEVSSLTQLSPQETPLHRTHTSLTAS